MTELEDILSEFGADLLLHHSQGLLVLLDERGRILDWNTSMAVLLSPTENQVYLTDVLVETSRPIFQRLITESLSQAARTQAVLHFAGNEMDLPGAYDCHIIPLKTKRAILFAHRVPPIDEHTAQDFVRLTNELSETTRDLQKAKHELGINKIELEDSLAKLELLARTDELTSLPNRRDILDHLQDETYRAIRYRTPLAVMLIDLDHFKFINVRFGHSAGDIALKETALAMQGQIRRTDTLGRYGGEEFLGVLPETTSQPALNLANRLRDQIARAKIAIGTGQKIQLTVSVGVASFQHEHDTPESVLKHADMALYRAKALGRNQACLWDKAAE